MAAPPAMLGAAVMELVDDPAIDVLVPSIGGHSAAASLRYLDFDRIAASGKKIVGFSDNSLISLVASAHGGAHTLHCLADVTFGFSAFARGEFPATERALLDAVVRDQHDLDLSEAIVVQRGEAAGIALGGNLRSLAQLAGTPYWPDWRGTILFWECADELHVMVQDLIHLSNTGVFDQIAGMVIGRTSHLEENFYERERVIPLDVLLLDVLDLRGRFPIVREAPIGHDAENLAIPMGVRHDLFRRRVSEVGGVREWQPMSDPQGGARPRSDRNARLEWFGGDVCVLHSIDDLRRLASGDGCVAAGRVVTVEPAGLVLASYSANVRVPLRVRDPHELLLTESGLMPGDIVAVAGRHSGDELTLESLQLLVLNTVPTDADQAARVATTQGEVRLYGDPALRRVLEGTDVLLGRARAFLRERGYLELQLPVVNDQADISTNIQFTNAARRRRAVVCIRARRNQRLSESVASDS